MLLFTLITKYTMFCIRISTLLVELILIITLVNLFWIVVVLDTNKWFHQTDIVGEELSITIGSEYD